MRAAADHGVRSPLIEIGLTKHNVRELARHWDLSVAEKPASPCLSSRIAYGVEVTPERVRRVEAAEAFLKQLLAIDVLRVRLEAGELARIEVPPEHLASLVCDNRDRIITTELRSLGFKRVTLDLEGFRSGSLNEVLPLVSLNAASTTGNSDGVSETEKS